MRARSLVAGMWLLIGVGWLGAACDDRVAPTPLVGSWTSDDERYAGRTLEVSPQWIRFLEGSTELGAVRVRSVTVEGAAEGPLHVEFEGNDRDGVDVTLAFELQLRPVELLRMETQREVWRRAKRPGGPL